jgi:succinate dehydrogenase/fumarate reductase flavoprotein subunit
MKELKARQQKKLNAAKEAQEKKDMLIEEVRQHFGYSVSIKDPRFQEMLEQKEKDIKKAEREAKKVKRADKAKASNAVLVEAIEAQKSS